MDPRIADFIVRERVCSLSVVLTDGTPHAAAVHYSEQIEPLKLFIQTSRGTTKVQALAATGVGKASVVIGFSEKDWLTIQMRGDVRIVSDLSELETVYKIHYRKHPETEQYKGPDTVFLEFTPTWWRFTDFNTHPETIIEK